MPPPSFLRVWSALLLLTVPRIAAVGAGAATYTAKLSQDPKCLDEVNAAREAVGFPGFTQATQEGVLPTPEGELTDGNWKKMCEYLIPTQAQTYGSEASAEPFKDGTYAFKPLTSDKPDCKSIVDSWKAAFENFTGLPPSQNQAAGLYDNQDNVSFVALYNPQSNATADCRVATCTKSAAPTRAVLDDSSGQAAENGYALICKTMPTAFLNKDTAPFTQDQWNMITSSLTGSTMTAVPHFAFLAIVALGMMLL
ncbi:SAG family member [Eimeria necatrix]|uniref:SAG family member n=1 Tax=Eimeria necatrix TaxID=51315 RepID=U6MMP8_9EIME|nr:SAG family member [Eimeria necatrix]CDJ64348.1 SAG family member [Eimeria necatrix]